MMAISRQDVVDALRRSFGAEGLDTLMAELDRYGVEPYERERHRVQLAIVGLAAGRAERLRHFVQAAKTDYRDVLLWAAAGPLAPEEGVEAQAAARALIERWGKT